ncbi:hypothetical protein HPP92_025376 [Vanilla planifolia]|uniref:Uncharacterized protein n=1 Tax=Vanilla planifolia TaxID=51239 RepID=A0A835UA52_VANPL|nr:hypothetical protein HPP92_025376 [Vanilla planifolia]
MSGSMVAVAVVGSIALLPGNSFRPYVNFLRASPPPQHRRSSVKKQTGEGLTSAALLASGAGFALAAVMCAFPSAAWAVLPVLEEPRNALSLPTWAIHVSSVIEWITAMALVWEYGEKSGFEAWKGLSWGMVIGRIPKIVLFEHIKEDKMKNSCLELRMELLGMKIMKKNGMLREDCGVNNKGKALLAKKKMQVLALAMKRCWRGANEVINESRGKLWRGVWQQ